MLTKTSHYPLYHSVYIKLATEQIQQNLIKFCSITIIFQDSRKMNWVASKDSQVKLNNNNNNIHITNTYTDNTHLDSIKDIYRFELRDSSYSHGQVHIHLTMKWPRTGKLNNRQSAIAWQKVFPRKLTCKHGVFYVAIRHKRVHAISQI